MSQESEYHQLVSRLDELEELKICYINKIQDILNETIRKRARKEELEKQLSQKPEHSENCNCIKCEEK